MHEGLLIKVEPDMIGVQSGNWKGQELLKLAILYKQGLPAVNCKKSRKIFPTGWLLVSEIVHTKHL